MNGGGATNGPPASADTAPRECVVLVNTLGRHSLWPVGLDAPVGWPVAYGPAARAACLRFIDRASSRHHPAAEAAAVRTPAAAPAGPPPRPPHHPERTGSP